MNIILMGIQGSGKGTQAKLLAKQLNLAHISTGDLFRSLTGELKEKVDALINKGNLVPDNLTLDILKKRFSEPDCKNGFILDGYPRNITQAKTLDNITNIDKIIEISLDDKESIKRLSGRRSCKSCNKEYNVNIPFLAPKNPLLCDICKKPLFQRDDDKTEESIKKRLDIYHKETKPILNHYKSIKINGNQSIDAVLQDILKALN
jgi:adenylate kinase